MALIYSNICRQLTAELLVRSFKFSLRPSRQEFELAEVMFGIPFFLDRFAEYITTTWFTVRIEMY